MKRKEKTRLKNAQSLITEQESGNKAEFAKKIETDPSYIYQIFSEVTSKNIGDDLARRIERAYNKPDGWMDNNHEDEEAMAIAREILKLPKEQLAIIKALLIKEDKTDTPSKVNQKT